jgi:hypothetical protein
MSTRVRVSARRPEHEQVLRGWVIAVSKPSLMPRGQIAVGWPAAAVSRSAASSSIIAGISFGLRATV